MTEKWKTIEGFEEYSVSDYGRVKRVKLLRLGEMSGYPSVSLGALHTAAVHKLVAKAFLPEIEGKSWVNHKDTDRRNNFVSNLERCTPKENSEHAALVGALGKAVKVVNNETGETTTYYSQSNVSKALGINPAMLNKKLNNGTPWNEYTFERLSS